MLKSFVPINLVLTLKRYDRFIPKLPLRVTQQKGNKDIKSLNAHNSVTIGPTGLADPSLESSFHALSDGQCVVSGCRTKYVIVAFKG